WNRLPCFQSHKDRERCGVLTRLSSETTRVHHPPWWRLGGGVAAGGVGAAAAAGDARGGISLWRFAGAEREDLGRISQRLERSRLRRGPQCGDRIPLRAQ